MEPVTLFVIASFTANAAATSRAPWSAPRIEKKNPRATLVLSIPAPTNLLVAPAAAPTAFVTLKDRLLKELEQFSPNAANSDPGLISSTEDISAAAEILRILPAGLPLPTLMRNDDGQIGMYWDNDQAYADINIEPGRTLSLFSRSRLSGKETFIDTISLASFTPSWAFENLSLLIGDNLAAA